MYSLSMPRVRWAGGGHSSPGTVVVVIAGLVLTTLSLGSLAAAAAASPTVDSTAGYALYFDGDDFVGLGNSYLLDPVSTYTIEAWVRADGPNDWSHIFTRYHHFEDIYGWELVEAGYTLGLNRFYDQHRFVFNSMGPFRTAASMPIPSWAMNDWYHVAAVCKWDTACLYLNGTLVGADESSARGYYRFGTLTLIGALREYGAIDGAWRGWIDEVRFWNSPRTAEQIQAMKNSTLTGKEAHLVGYWNFDEGAGQIAHDGGPNGLHGTLGASTGPGPDDPQWVISTAPIQASPCSDRSAPPGVLSYDDGDGSADTFVGEPDSASFLVRFSVPSTFTGLRQVAKITWYPGTGAIQSPKAVVREDLSGGFGTANNCVVEEVDQVIPLEWNEVDLRENPKEFLVQAGDVFYAGIHGTGISIGADTATTLFFMGATGSAPSPAVPSPDFEPGLEIACWGKRNYLLNELGIRSPVGNISMVPVGDPKCGTYFCPTVCFEACVACTTPSSLYCFPVCCDLGAWSPCLYWCSRSFLAAGHDWLIRASLAGTMSPELSPGCYDRSPFDTPTPTPAPAGPLWIFR